MFFVYGIKERERVGMFERISSFLENLIFKVFR